MEEKASFSLSKECCLKSIQACKNKQFQGFNFFKNLCYNIDSSFHIHKMSERNIVERFISYATLSYKRITFTFKYEKEKRRNVWQKQLRKRC